MGGRAGNGESSVQRDENGRWHGYVSLGNGADGRRDRRHVSGAKRAEVVAMVRALEAQRAAGTVTTAGRPPTVAEWLEHWLSTIATRRVRYSTLTGYRGYIRNRIVPAIGHLRLDRLQPEHVEQMYVELEAAGLAAASILQCHRILSRALKVALQRGRVGRNVCTLVDAPSVRREEVEPLTGDDARAILTTAAGTRNAARWSVALALGLRQGEALGLTWSAIELDAGTLSVRQALQRQTGVGLVMVPPKSRAGTRTIMLPDPLVEALRAHRAAQLAERLHAGTAWTDHDLVFARENGQPIDPTVDHRDWTRLLAAAGVRHARLHDARHTAATLLLQQGVPARVVMQVLGHSQITLTLGTYSHVVPELAKEAADGMANALWPQLAPKMAPFEPSRSQRRGKRPGQAGAPSGT